MVFSKKSFFLFVLISLTFSCLFGQVVSSSGTDSVNENEITLTLPEVTSESNLTFSETGRKSTVWPFVRMIFMLILVVAAVYGVMYFLKRRGTGTRSDDQFLRRVAYLSLGQGKSVEVVTLLDKGAYLLGVTEGGINLISEVKDEELIQAMNLYADKTLNTSKPKNFSDVLDIFMPGGPRDNTPTRPRQNTNVFSAGEQDMDQIFRDQAKRLNENE